MYKTGDSTRNKKTRASHEFKMPS